MKGTIVLLAGIEAENYGRKLMLEAHRAGNIGFEMVRLPQHVSLKQPFVIPGLPEFEEFFDGFSKEVKPIQIQFEKLEVMPSNVLGGQLSGVISIRARKSNELAALQNKLFKDLERRFGPCPAEHDNDYIFHMTVALGKAPYSSYEKAYKSICNGNYEQKFLFDKLGLLYYDDDNINPGTYFCYKMTEL